MANDKNLLIFSIFDIALQILSFVAGNERNNIFQKQSEDIKITSEILEIFKKYKNKKCSYKEALKSSSLSHGTFYNYYRIFFKNNS